ncbi:MAG: zf-HC2 domain-containing protein [Lachnospiraceae bacterium]|nr:zf-HC2 domain-containing protein [Lachnospiraceae bacterium]
MNRELDCEIVKDLLPLYVDGMVSEVSKKSIDSHLEYCKDCTKVYENMTFGLEKQPSEVEDVKKFLKKTKRMYFLYGLGGLSFIAILVCMIVDLALNKGITWSLIVGTSVVFANVLMYALLVCKKNKAYITMAVISIGTVLLLSTIQISRYYFMNIGSLWIFRYGFPIMLLWLGIIWIPVLCKCMLKWNLWDCIAVFMLMVLIGNYVTKLITGDYSLNDLWSMHNFIGNGLGEVIGAILFGIVGRIKKWRK